MSEFEGDFQDTPRRVSVVDMAHEIVSMDYELRRLREENAELREYRRKYLDELESGIKHGEHMMAGLLKIAMTPGVLDCMSKANAEQSHE